MRLLEGVTRISTAVFLGMAFAAWAILLLSTVDGIGAMLEGMLR